MMCSTRLIWRFPARDRRWRTCSPEEAPIGAVPFDEAKWASSGNLVTSLTSASSRAAPEGPIPGRLVKVVAVAASSALAWAADRLYRCQLTCERSPWVCTASNSVDCLMGVTSFSRLPSSA
jgi:hypothetical protein